MTAGIERRRELRRRRHRTKTYPKIVSKIAKASATDKEKLAAKLRKMTPGCEELIKAWGLE